MSDSRCLVAASFRSLSAKVAGVGGLVPIIQPFAALYVLILATFAPLMAKESERIYDLSMKLLNGVRDVRW
jgi:CPA2 family monovalent cation:H+ antiporter-2